VCIKLVTWNKSILWCTVRETSKYLKYEHVAPRRLARLVAGFESYFFQVVIYRTSRINVGYWFSDSYYVHHKRLFVTFTTIYFGQKLRPSSGRATIIQNKKTEVEASHLHLKYKFYKLKKNYYCLLECLI